MSKSIKYNIGGGPKRINGFKNIDGLDWDGATDIKWNITDIPYDFAEDDSVDEIVSIECLEHISWRETLNVLKEWRRMLKPGGRITIQVPAIDKMCEMFVKGEICGCVLHKPKSEKDARGVPGCWNCKGKAKVNPMRWLMAFCGAQKHRFDNHLNIFTKQILESNLKEAGFEKININYDKYEWKLIAKAFKKVV